MNAGLSDRTIAATNMNETSSRAHTIIGLKVSDESEDKHNLNQGLNQGSLNQGHRTVIQDSLKI